MHVKDHPCTVDMQLAGELDKEVANYLLSWTRLSIQTLNGAFELHEL